MAPIDLPPELLLHHLSTVSVDVAPTGERSELHLLSLYTAQKKKSIEVSIYAPAESFRSLIPSHQLSEHKAKDFSHPNVAQLPDLPLEVEPESSIQSTTDAATLDEAADAANEGLVDNHSRNDALPEAAIDGDLEGVAEKATLDITQESTDSTLEQDVSDTLETVDTSTLNSAEQPLTETEPRALDPAKLEITADTQIFNADRQVVNARGNVVFKLNNAFLLADELWINLVNRYVLAEGNVILTRGEQEVRGERAEYNLLQEAGTLYETRGEFFLPELENDFASPLEAPITSRSVFDPLNPDQDVTNVTNAGGFTISSSVQGTTPGSLPDSSGDVSRLRFEAARVNFDAETWVAEEVRLTNDPFSPPELEFRTDRMTLVTLSPTADLLTAEDPRLVFDQGLSLPLVRSNYVLNRGAVNPNQVNPFPINIGSDGRDRGGIFLESEFPLVRNESTNFTVTPQYFLERALDGDAFDSDVFGVELDFDTRLNPRSDLSARATITGLNLDDLEENIRGNIRNRNLIGDHVLATEYNYRDRLFNGSLGFQTVRSSLGAILLSPVIDLDNRGLKLTYQVGGQWITANTDRDDLLDPPPRSNNRISLGRLQASARLRKGFNLWRGEPLPATQTEGLRYTPVPLVPFLNLNLSLLGVGSYYTSGDFQEVLAGDIRLDGQFGHLSDNFFDYTRFNLGYYQAILASENSPFRFDRNVDRSVITFGVVQQIFGPILLGFQSSINLETNERVNTEIVGEYSRRTYGLVLRYSPTRETGSIGFRLSDFNWLGSGSPFDEPNIRQVEGSIVEQR
ncbi:MAG: DUF3769 domain-containing protein [Cyanobacteria bacterium P01_D01_bin.156]